MNTNSVFHLVDGFCRLNGSTGSCFICAFVQHNNDRPESLPSVHYTANIKNKVTFLVDVGNNKTKLRRPCPIRSLCLFLSQNAA